MRRTALRVGGAALLALVAMAGRWSAPEPAHAATVSYYFKPTPGYQHRAPIKGGEPGTPGRTWGYWGRLDGIQNKNPLNTPTSGSYRATCVWLADLMWASDPKKRDNRMLCTVLLSFHALPTSSPYVPNGGSVVLQGLVKRPPKKETLFANPSARLLAITGGTGPFKEARGFAELSKAPAEIKITRLT
jgi:hypothetical protein